jgi:hypothetical protein
VFHISEGRLKKLEALARAINTLAGSTMEDEAGASRVSLQAIQVFLCVATHPLEIVGDIGRVLVSHSRQYRVSYKT